MKHIKVYANNKPWITTNVKEIINRKKCIFGKGSVEELKGVNRELKRVIKQEKAKYKNKVEENFTENNMKRVWHGMKLMSGYSNGGKKSCLLPKTTAEYADDLNLFFNRFDKYDFSAEVENLRISLSSQNDSNWNLITTEEEVRRIFASQNPSKAA